MVSLRSPCLGGGACSDSVASHVASGIGLNPRYTAARNVGARFAARMSRCAKRFRGKRAACWVHQFREASLHPSPLAGRVGSFTLSKGTTRRVRIAIYAGKMRVELCLRRKPTLLLQSLGVEGDKPRTHQHAHRDTIRIMRVDVSP